MCALLSLAHLSSPLVIHLRSAKVFSRDRRSLCWPLELPQTSQTHCLAVWSGCTTLCETEGHEGEREALHCTKDNQGRAESHVCFATLAVTRSLGPCELISSSFVRHFLRRLKNKQTRPFFFRLTGVCRRSHHHPPLALCLSHSTPDTSTAR